MKTTIVSILFLIIGCLQGLSQIGSWKVYPAYHDITDVEPAGKRVYVLASGGLFCYDKDDNSIQTYDKKTGLNDVEINHIAYSSAAKRLIIVYKNNNIDLLDGKGNVTNIADYYKKSLTEDKTINNIYVNGIYAYLSTGFGIVKINVSNAEISDTYFLGFRVDWTLIQQNKIIAASMTHGKYAADLSTNLLDKKNWKRIGNYTENIKVVDNELWNKMESLRPEGPKYNHFYFLEFVNNRLYTSGGGFESEGVSLSHPGIIQVLDDGQWHIYQDDIQKTTGYSYADINCLAIDPKDENHVFAGGRTGLYEFQNGKLTKYYNKDNSILMPAVDKGKELDNEYVLINGLLFDEERHLWILNNQTKGQSIIELLPDGTMKSHHQPSLMRNGVSPSLLYHPMFDSRGLLWFGNGNYKFPALFCYDRKTETLHTITNFINQDGNSLKTTAVKYIAEDMENNLWIGTNTGVLLLEASKMNQLPDVTFTQIKIPRNDGTNLADYLLAGVDITCIAVDKSNRKWFGTGSNGVYLISADNNQQIHHFTIANSVLPSNHIESIAINNQTGEVFFGTDKGLCSFQSDATEAVESMNKDVTYAYPNPVEPSYNGPITVVGLSYQADIKIVTVNGTLVTKGKSNGGTFVWDGNDMNGNPVASGIYMVQTADQTGNKGTVCKIAIVR